MPKIPLYQDQSRIGTAKGVTIDPTSYIEASTAGIEQEADFMQNVLKLGGEAINQFKKSKEEGDKANYQTSVNNLKVELDELRAAHSDLNDVEFNDQVVKPKLDSFYKDWSEGRGFVDFKLFNGLWEKDKNTFETKYTGLATVYKNEQYEVDQTNLANSYYNDNKIVEGDSIIDNIGTMNPEEKDKAKKSGHYNRILTNIIKSKNLDELRQVYNDSYLDTLAPRQKFELERLAIYEGRRLLREKYKPFYDEGIDLAKKGDLGKPWIESQRQAGSLPEGALLLFEGFVEGQASQNLSDLDKKGQEKATDLIKTINNFAETGEIVIPTMIGDKTKVKTFDNRFDALNYLFEEASKLNLSPSTVQEMMSPLTSAFDNDERNVFFLDGTIEINAFPTSNTTYSQERNILMGYFRKHFNSIAGNLPSGLYNENYLAGMSVINKAILEAEKQGIDIKKEEGNQIIQDALNQVYVTARSYEAARSMRSRTDLYEFTLDIGEEFFPEK